MNVDFSSPDPELVTHARAVYTRLLEHFGLPDWQHPQPAIDELVCTILSQNTNDRNRDSAFNALIRRYPTWEAARDAPLAEVIAAIRPAGLANQKGARIQQVLRQISAERGNLDLSFLKNMPFEEAKAWLLQFKGVGPKTTAIVLLFSLGIPAFPVDTHVYRVSGRLGLRPADMTVDEAHPHLASLFEPQTYGPAHLNLIRLGREICQARKPLCAVCPLTALCDYYHARDTGLPK
jgi:endonuclease III